MAALLWLLGVALLVDVGAAWSESAQRIMAHKIVLRAGSPVEWVASTVDLTIDRDRTLDVTQSRPFSELADMELYFKLSSDLFQPQTCSRLGVNCTGDDDSLILYVLFSKTRSTEDTIYQLLPL